MKDQNIRRENKLYSYKEQMADLELRKVGKIGHGQGNLGNVRKSGKLGNRTNF